MKHSLSSPPETPPDSGIRENNDLVSFRKAGHAVPKPLLILGIRLVTIVAAQSLQLGMVVGHNYFFIVRISRLTLLCLILMLFSLRILFFCFHRFQCVRNFDVVTCLYFPTNF